MLTIQDVRDYLGIDWSDDATNRRLTNLMSTADYYLKGSLGADYPKSDPRVSELSLIIIGELYDNADPIAKVSAGIEKLVYDFSIQLRLEMRGG